MTQQYTHGRLYNLYLDPKESRELHDPQARVHRQLHQTACADHFMTFGKYPPKQPIASMT